jgi:hypothetical protein
MRQEAEEKGLERLRAWAIDGEDYAVVFGSAPAKLHGMRGSGARI